MRYSIDTAPRDGKVVILEDVASVTFNVARWSPEVGRWVDENGEPDKIRPTHWFPLGRDKYLLQENEGSSNPSRAGPSPPRSRWPFAASSITAAFVAAALVGVYFPAEVAAYVKRYTGQPNILGGSTIGERVAQTRLPSQDSRKVNWLTALQGGEEDQAYPQDVAQAKQVWEASASRQFLDTEQRAEVLANELAQARRAINRLNLQLRAGAANSEKLLGQEREKTATLVQAAAATRHQLEEERARGAALAGELAVAQREIETQAAQVRKASDEAMQLEQITERTTVELQQERDSLRTDAANFAQLLGQERERTAAIAQEAVAAREELTASTAQHRQALDEERARRTALWSGLAVAQREVETQAAQLRKAGNETRQLEQITERTAVELQQERDSLRTDAANFAQLLGQERERTAAIAQEAAAAREELTASTAQHRRSLDEESARYAALWSELAVAQREIETQAAQVRKASDEAMQLEQITERTTVELQQERDSLRTDAANFAQLLGQERERTAAIAQEAVAAREELTASTAQHRQALDEERARRTALWSELAVAQREVETQAAQLRKAGNETRQLEQITERTTVELQQERDNLRTDAANSVELLGHERERTATLVHEATAARHELEDERARGTALASELAMTRSETETNEALLDTARDDAAEFNQIPEKTTAELQQVRDGAPALWKMAQESARRVKEARTMLERTANSQINMVMQTVEATAPEQPEATVSQTGPEADRLMVRARGLLGQGNIGAARIVLELVAETGSAQASFALAETYDPVILSTWGAYGTRGDATKARELYAKAHAGGIREAKNRIDALEQ